jgi:DNA-binding transcriptional LysR family regulator
MRDKYDLKDLLTFVTISNLKSFTKAADKLNISKSVVTKRINDLEGLVGMILLARTKKEVNLTTEGKNFLNYCNEILRNVDRLDDFVDSCKEIRGKLRIVLPPYFSRYYIVPYFEEFLQKYPNLKLDITLTENPVNIIEESYDSKKTRRASRAA